MQRRFLTRSLVLAAILAACLGHAVWNGSRARRIVAENLPRPPLSSHKRDTDLWHPTASFGHVYDLTWEWPLEKPWSLPEGARLEIQLASAGRTRLLVARSGHPNSAVTWGDVLRGRERVQAVGDRGWVDLGPLPSEGTRLEVQVYGLLPGTFGFAEQNQPGTAHFSAFRIRRPDSPLARPSRTIVRYRFRAPEPVSAGETMSRIFFFVSCSRVLQVTLLLAGLLLVAGWWWLWEGAVSRAVVCLIPAVTLLHACMLAPLQGADEATHVGTVEALLFNPELFRDPAAYPKSIALLSDAIGYDSWVRYADLPVTGLLPEDRDATRAVASRALASEAREDAGKTADAELINPRTRAPIYYNAFRLAGPLLTRLTVLDRVEACVVLSALMSLLFFVGGSVVLSRARVDGSVVAIYGLVALLPYSVGVVASCSNYSLAIGIGQFLSACLVAGVLTDSPRDRLLAAGVFSLVSSVAIGVWDDFVFFAAPSLLITTALAAVVTRRLPPGRRRTLVTWGVVTLGTLATVAFAWSLATGQIRRVVSSLGARLPRALGGFDDPSFWMLLAAAGLPVVVSLLLVLGIVRARHRGDAYLGRAAWLRTIGLAVLLAVLFVLTPWTAVPFETARLDYPDEVLAHLASFWSNNFSFDQDVLSWQMYWGVFGYADVSYPMAVYALARWTCVALFLALPVLSWRFTRRSPARSAALLAASGFAVFVCVVTNSLRYFQPTNPWGRFVLPLVPLVALPLLVRTDRSPVPWRIALLALIALHVWTALALLGSRYALGL